MDCSVEDGGKWSLLEVTLVKCGGPGGSELGELRGFIYIFVYKQGDYSHISYWNRSNEIFHWEAKVHNSLFPLIGHCVLVEEIRQKIVSAYYQVCAAHTVRALKHINTQPSEEWSQDPLDNFVLGCFSDPV